MDVMTKIKQDVDKTQKIICSGKKSQNLQIDEFDNVLVTANKKILHFYHTFEIQILNIILEMLFYEV